MNSSQRPTKNYTRGGQGRQVIGTETSDFDRLGRRTTTSRFYGKPLKPDRRRKKNLRYVRLCSFDPHGVFTITKNILTGRASIAIRPTEYPVYDTLDAKKMMKLYAALTVCGLPYPCLGSLEWERLAKMLNVTSEHFATGLRFYEEEFLEKIKKQKKAYKISLKAHRRRR